MLPEVMPVDVNPSPPPPPPPPPPRAVVTYWAISVLSSRTMWFNAATLVVSALSMTEVVSIIPAHYIPFQVAFAAVVNMWLRTTTTRPVAFIPQGATAPVSVPKIDPPGKPTSD